MRERQSVAEDQGEGTQQKPSQLRATCRRNSRRARSTTQPSETLCIYAQFLADFPPPLRSPKGEHPGNSMTPPCPANSPTSHHHHLSLHRGKQSPKTPAATTHGQEFGGKTGGERPRSAPPKTFQMERPPVVSARKKPLPQKCRYSEAHFSSIPDASVARK